MSGRLDRVEAILQVLAQETLANAQAIVQNTEVIANLRASIVELRDVVEQQNCAIPIPYLMSQD
ncbi:MAG: hypothetical protein SNJ85_01880 [Cyanobacteriota bacterium]